MRLRTLVVAAILLAGAPSVGAAVTGKDPSQAMDVAAAMEGSASIVTGASFPEYPPAGILGVIPSAGVSDATITTAFGLPQGPTFAVLSSGDATSADGGGTSTDHGSTARGAHDVVILKVDVQIPSPHNCLALNLQFLSAEYPTYVGSNFNDAFIAEFGTSTWTVSGGIVNAPDNFAFDAGGAPLTINSATMSASNAGGSPYGGATSLLMAATPATPGSHSVYFSVFDASDGQFDSAVFMDNLRSFQAPPGTCKAGIQQPPPPIAWDVPTPATVCAGQPTRFDDLSTGGSGITENAFDFGDGNSIARGPRQTPVYHTYAAPGGYTATVDVWDSTGSTASNSFTVRVRHCPPPPNDPPVLLDPGFIEINVGGQIAKTIQGYDPDQDPTIFSATSLPGGSFDPGTQEYTWSPELPGVYEAHFRITEDTPAAQHDDGVLLIEVVGSEDVPESNDADGDGVPDSHDNCGLPNPDQADNDGDGIGDACQNQGTSERPQPEPENPPESSSAPPQTDADKDGIPDSSDNCVFVPNRDQADLDGDLAGDACDADVDGDRIPDYDAEGRPLDNCRFTPNVAQRDADGDGQGDVCDAAPLTFDEPASETTEGQDTSSQRLGGVRQGAALQASLGILFLILAGALVALLLRRD